MPAMADLVTDISPQFRVAQFVPSAIVAIALRKGRRIPKYAADSIVPTVNDSVAECVVIVQASANTRISWGKNTILFAWRKGKMQTH